MASQAFNMQNSCNKMKLLEFEKIRFEAQVAMMNESNFEWDFSDKEKVKSIDGFWLNARMRVRLCNVNISRIDQIEVSKFCEMHVENRQIHLHFQDKLF